MRLSRFGLAPLAVTLPFLLLTAQPGSAASLSTEYSVTVRGFPVGRAHLQAEFADGRYTIQFSGGIRGLARLFSNAETSAASVGALGDSAMAPATYRHVWTEDGETETVDMQFSGRRLTEMALAPPEDHPERYVPITSADKADVLDPVSAFVWPVAGGVTPDICARTLSLIDGRRRFDIALRYERMEDFSTRDRSFRGRAAVCSFSYHPVAGHRIDKPDHGTIASGSGMEVWMAPVGPGLAAPARIQLRTRIGRIVLVATSIHAN
jgi:hypothetical protein